ncbi:hypothetical protein QLQ12_41695 [Actinoplanes sp. NEAU-A12]|uniref:Uncharacterized protein n=1 Tax=Actinoplanes sandaracinus TaxID=3045177 RepID=A0ABT6WZE3_9ACTN|nr:hypothetical protein [Actinoplanes sandaracinus]MDI6105118.1 hypothetical protein [Actinoplanes sandaracinus]
MTKRPSEVGPPRKFHALNDAGRERLATFWAKWQYVSSRIDRLREGGDEPSQTYAGVVRKPGTAGK